MQPPNKKPRQRPVEASGGGVVLKGQLELTISVSLTVTPTVLLLKL